MTRADWLDGWLDVGDPKSYENNWGMGYVVKGKGNWKGGKEDKEEEVGKRWGRWGRERENERREGKRMEGWVEGNTTARSAIDILIIKKKKKREIIAMERAGNWSLSEGRGWKGG